MSAPAGSGGVVVFIDEPAVVHSPLPNEAGGVVHRQTGRWDASKQRPLLPPESAEEEDATAVAALIADVGKEPKRAATTTTATITAHPQRRRINPRTVFPLSPQFAQQFAAVLSRCAADALTEHVAPGVLIDAVRALIAAPGDSSTHNQPPDDGETAHVAVAAEAPLVELHRHRDDSEPTFRPTRPGAPVLPPSQDTARSSSVLSWQLSLPGDVPDSILESIQQSCFSSASRKAAAESARRLVVLADDDDSAAQEEAAALVAMHPSEAARPHRQRLDVEEDVGLVAMHPSEAERPLKQRLDVEEDVGLVAMHRGEESQKCIKPGRSQPLDEGPSGGKKIANAADRQRLQSITSLPRTTSLSVSD